ncbi:MAG: photosystem II stability/assembly factor-like uncharacterized protein, partial [Thalassolituus oleivorans]
MRHLITVLLLLAIATSTTPALAQPAESLLVPFSWRNIGPANMMGRISAVDGYDQDWRVFLVGAASGGVWKTTNGGTTFEPIFDDYGSQSIGDVAFFQADTSVVWVGTGEATNRNSVGWGDGVYKSSDGGATFRNMGLKESYQISEIATHPTDPDVVYVAAVGHLFDYSGDRGLYKTTDGGQTWTKLTVGLPDNGRLGATVVAVDPHNPEVVYAGLYDRRRQPHIMQSGGPGGGLFKSTDAGASWVRLTEGLPSGDLGQIDIDIYPPDPNTLVAFVEASEDLPAGGPQSGVYRSDDAGATWRFVRLNFSRPTYHGRVRIDPTNPDNIFVISRSFAFSRDGGETFTTGQPWRVDGGDDHDLWISPQDGRVIVMATDQGARISLDGGESAFMLNNMAIGQFYAIGADMRDPYWVYGGLQDNGGWAIPSNSRSTQGILTDHAFEVNGGDGFHMQVDPDNWRTVYTTVHVGYFGRFDPVTRRKVIITPAPDRIVNYREVYDPGFGEKQIDYTINPGNYWLGFDGPTGDLNGSVLPPQFRFNWNSPLVLSPSNGRTVYVGGNYLFRSVDAGDTWRIISPDLTQNDPATRNPSDSGGLTKDVTGAENHHTIYTIDESALDPAVVWVGTDDGLVQVTRDGGATWKEVGANLPGSQGRIWVSRVEASRHDKATAYVTLDGHWTGDTAPYVFRTRDFGRSWEGIASGLPSQTPAGSVHTIVEDPVNPNLLYVGTEFGVHLSMDGGISWHPFMNGLPPVAVHDLVLHPRDNDLIAGTHGRSIWIADDLSALQQLAETSMSAHVFSGRPGTRWQDHGKGRIQTYFKFRGANPSSGATVRFFLAETPPDSAATVTIEDPVSGRTETLNAVALAGINSIRWNMAFSPTTDELEAQQERLIDIAAGVREAVATTQDDRALWHMRRDLLAPHRSPSTYDDHDYPDSGDRAILLAHLAAIDGQIGGAGSWRQLNGARSQLMAYSFVVGDR